MARHRFWPMVREEKQKHVLPSVRSPLQGSDSSRQEIAMITHPLPHYEAPSSRPLFEDAPRSRGEQLQRYLASETRAARTVHFSNSTLALLQLLLGYEWLLAGADKLLLGTFPAQLSGLLQASLSGGHLPGFLDRKSVV